MMGCTDPTHVMITPDAARPRPGDECLCHAYVVATDGEWVAWTQMKPSGICFCGVFMDDHPWDGCDK